MSRFVNHLPKEAFERYDDELPPGAFRTCRGMADIPVVDDAAQLALDFEGGDLNLGLAPEQ